MEVPLRYESKYIQQTWRDADKKCPFCGFKQDITLYMKFERTYNPRGELIVNGPDGYSAKCRRCGEQTPYLVFYEDLLAYVTK